MRLNIRAVLLGASVDLAGSSFFGSILALPWWYWLLSTGVPQTQLYPTLLSSPAFLLVSGVIGLGFSFLGGYVAASFARERFCLHGAASAIPCVITGAFEVLSPFGTIFPGWLLWGGKLGAVLFAFLGGRYAKRRYV